MKPSFLRTFCQYIAAGLLAIPANRAPAANIWVNTNAVGFWKYGTNWSTGQAPYVGLGGTWITNRATKTVVVDAGTPLTNLFINSLSVWAPTNSTNTLLLQNLGANPLVVSNSTFEVRMRGAIQVTNSSLVIAGRFINFDVFAGSVTLDSGSIIAREEPLTTDVTVRTRIGRTNTATVTINGGSMQTTVMDVGESPNTSIWRSKGIVRMTDGLLAVAGELSIGTSPGCTGLVEMIGGRIVVPNNLTNIMRIGDQGLGTMSVSNSTVVVGDVSVARHDGSVGTLVLLQDGFWGGSDDFSIGRFSGATGMVFVAGGQMVITNHPIWIGREGNGQLIVSNGLVEAAGIQVAVVPTNTAHGSLTLAGGSILVSSNFTLGAGSVSTGQAVIIGGSLTITNGENDAYLMIPSGTMMLNAGNVIADNVFLTNNAGRLTFNAGALHTKGMLVSNGLPFTVGDGTNAATLDLLGGMHIFANGLVISSNAVLTGCGIIIGSVINLGTIATNCGTSGGTAPGISQQPMSLTVTQGATAQFTVAATGTPPLFYQWRFGVPGTGGGNVPGATNSTFVISNAQPTDAGNYRCIVTNTFGTTNSALAVLRVLVSPVVTNVTFATNTTTLSFQSVNDLNYVLEYKNHLEDANWMPLVTTNGTGAVITLIDTTATESTRFYRLGVQ